MMKKSTVNWMKCFTFFHKAHFIARIIRFFTQIKITAFQAIADEKFSRWTFQHFYVRLMNILKCSIEICEQYEIKIQILYSLEDYAERAALGLLHSFMYDFGTTYCRSWKIDYLILIEVYSSPSPPRVFSLSFFLTRWSKVQSFIFSFVKRLFTALLVF